VFVGAYGGAVVLFTIGILTRGIVFSISVIKKSVSLHNKMFKSVIFAKMSFFNATPIGRILNGFARHQYAIDAQLADSLMQLLQYLPLTLGAIILVIVVMYQTIGVFGSALIIGAAVVIYKGRVESRLRDQDAVSRSHIFSHLTASLEGLFSIRAYEAQQRFVDLFKLKIDENHKFQFAIQEIKCWRAFYLDILVSLIIYCTVVVVVELRNEYPAATSGLVLSNVLQLLVFLQWTVRMFGEVIDKLGSVKQVSYYGNCVEQEPPHIIENNRPPPNWPARGNIKFSNIVLKYHEFGVAVLKSVSINIKAKEKVGIVGRTGSGKSTLLISLLRIVESCEGQITIDGIDISKIGLEDLRNKITIIPQEPILFVGTIRKNIDLFDKCSDEQIWSALDSVQLGDVIRKLDQKLEAPVVGLYKFPFLFVLYEIYYFILSLSNRKWQKF
jgi:ABC-type multidrug transport system fused ATPase/permease subunit